MLTPENTLEEQTESAFSANEESVNPYVTPTDMQEYTKLGEELQSITPEKTIKTIAEFTPVVGDVMAATLREIMLEQQ